MRRFAVSDIHGCAYTFEALLDKLALTTHDELYILGDLINKGPHSKRVIDLIMTMQREGYQVQVTKGNHELNLLEGSQLGEKRNGYRKRLYGPRHFLESFEVAEIDEIPDSYLNWIDALPNYLILPDFFLVHAGINFKSEQPLQDFRSLLTIRGWYEDIDREWLGERIIVHGHTPTRFPSIKVQLANLEALPVVNIDNGTVYPDALLGGLCALDLDKRQLHRQQRQPADDTVQGYYFD